VGAERTNDEQGTLNRRTGNGEGEGSRRAGTQASSLKPAVDADRGNPEGSGQAAGWGEHNAECRVQNAE